ncbi:hypothetical protein MPDQ_004360 [Monascus purpureus]|uniref:GST N-terminal domain-containing protein n=1 Tax=Monascus purpureus TaxID=5098 RepID=A0A507R0F8_MONPU|nr:hypothetical protein MPDQ_004360 [Monascus purpureus]BDD64238.1 hypothetical protein MAP00_009076 [Monascus purpureus]
MAPPEYCVIQDGDLSLAESGAIIEYILTKYGGQSKSKSKNKLVPESTSERYPDYRFRFHHTNTWLQSASMTLMIAKFARLSEDNALFKAMNAQFNVI